MLCDEVILLSIRCKGKLLLTSARCTLLAAMVYHIWKERNCRLHLDPVRRLVHVLQGCENGT